MNTVEKLTYSLTNFYYQMKNIPNHRYLSWEHCYSRFIKARSKKNYDIDNLSLHLSFYLASWGMYRGSSFLLQRDYKVHCPIVEEILKPEYDVLVALNFEDLLNNKNKQQEMLKKLSDKLTSIYGKIRKDVIQKEIKKDASSVLLTKVLLGTLACTPAYDRFFVDAIKSEKITTGNYNLCSMLGLAEFYQEHSEDFEKVRKIMRLVDGTIYLQMKFIDMGLWKIGFENSPEFKANKK